MTNHKAGGWHPEVITASTEATLRNLFHAKLLDGFYLAGGTGLALHLGHRLSQDLDCFASDLFDEEALLERVRSLAGFSLVARAPHSLHTTIEGTKVSFLGYDYPLLFPSTRFLDVDVADVRDIACMKVTAIASRGTKRDFVDLYACARVTGLGNLLELFDRKYSQSRYNRLHVLKSLMYFEDAEKDPMPHMLVSLEWDEVKRFFLREVRHLWS
jgi:hypothetical protein